MGKILSISIAAYNVENYLEKTLDSFIIPDVMDKIEVIVVNDGSKDSTLKIAKKYEEQYPDTYKIIDKPNGGYGSTINASIPVATGKYYRLLDGDDWFDKDALISFVKELENSNEDMIITKFRRVFESDNHEEEHDETVVLKKITGTFEDIELKDWFTMHAITYKTEILQKNNIVITEHCFYTDQEYDLLPLKYVETIKKVPVCLYCYRIGRAEQSVSPEGMEKHYKEQMIVFKKIFDIYKDIEKSNDAMEKYVSFYLSKRLRVYLKNLLLITPTKKHKYEIREFCCFCKLNSPIIYERAIKQSKSLMLLVKTDFVFYKILHYRAIKSI